jgi:hypothetical protein
MESATDKRELRYVHYVVAWRQGFTNEKAAAIADPELSAPALLQTLRGDGLLICEICREYSVKSNHCKHAPTH